MTPSQISNRAETAPAKRSLGPLRPLQGAALAVASMLFLLVLLEIGASFWGMVRRSHSARSVAGSIVIVRDHELGWRPAPHRNLPLPAETSQQVGANAPSKSFSTDAFGWRRYDRRLGEKARQGLEPSESLGAEDERPLLLVIGDSFTHGEGVADDALYYDELSRVLGFDVNALGVNGYGTLQELWVAREEKARMPEPDAVLLQLADNDVINDSFELERRSWLNNNLLPRPYLRPDDRPAVDPQVVSAAQPSAGPTPIEVEIRDPRRWFEHSTLGRQLTRRVLSHRLRSIEQEIEAGDPDAMALYSRELYATARALVELRSLFPEAKAYAFNVGGNQSRVSRDLARLSQLAGFEVLDIGSIGDEDGDLVLADGAHWNERGHRLAGQRLAAELAAALDH